MPATSTNPPFRSPAWPPGLPATLHTPRTSLYYNVEAAARRYPDKAAIQYFGTAISYAQLQDEIERMAGYLQQACGIQPGDRVALIAENRPEWLIADLAIMSAGAITVPAFATNTTEDHRHILTHSGAKGVIAAGGIIAKRLLPAALQAPDIKFHIAIDADDKAAQMPFKQLTWAEAIALAGDNVAASTIAISEPADVRWRAILRYWPVERFGRIRRRPPPLQAVDEGGEPACTFPEALIAGS